LLKLLDIKGAVITIDAMGTQKAIAGQIIEQGANYVLALKGNHSLLHQDVIDYFDYLKQPNTSASVASIHETVDKGHGRLETRHCEVVTDLQWLEDRKQWAGLSSLIKDVATPCRLLTAV
jgi:predicted transposase YbfD/YdcC